MRAIFSCAGAMSRRAGHAARPWLGPAPGGGRLLPGAPRGRRLERRFQQGQFVQHVAREQVGVRHQVGAGRDADEQLAVVAVGGHVQADAVVDDGDRQVGGDPGPGDIERHRRPRHVGHDHVERQRHPVRDVGMAHQPGEAAEQPGQADGGHVVRDQRLGRVGVGLGRIGGTVNRGEPRQRVGDPGVQVHGDERHLDRVLGVAVGAGRHRHAGEQRLARQQSALQQPAAQRARGDGQHDVVDGALRASCEASGVIQRDFRGGEGAASRDHLVQDRPRGLGGGCIPRAQQARGGAGHRGEPSRQLTQFVQLVGSARGQQPQRRVVVGLGQRGTACRGGKPRRRVHEGLQEQLGRVPVEPGVVHLHVQRRAAAGEALDEVQFPQWPVTIEQRLVQPCDPVFQLAQGAGPGQDRPAHVMVEVDGAGGHPHRVGQVQRQARQPAGEDLAGPEPAADHRAEPLEERPASPRWDLVQQEQGADVHRRGRGLPVQENGIEQLDRLHLGSFMDSRPDTRGAGPSSAPSPQGPAGGGRRSAPAAAP
jgi:hypothetical protein